MNFTFHNDLPRKLYIYWELYFVDKENVSRPWLPAKYFYDQCRNMDELVYPRQNLQVKEIFFTEWNELPVWWVTYLWSWQQTIIGRSSSSLVHHCRTHVDTTGNLAIDNYANDGLPVAVWILCSFYHDPFRAWIIRSVNNLLSELIYDSPQI